MANVQAIAQVPEGGALAKLFDVPRRCFDAVNRDGANPDKISIGNGTSLLGCVARKRGFEGTRDLYEHALWVHLMKRAPSPWPTRNQTRSSWLNEQLHRYQLMRVEPPDADSARALGLLPESSWEDDRAMLFPLTLDAERFTTPDGLLLLLLLYREAQDAAHYRLATHLANVLSTAASRYAPCSGSTGEFADTWQYLVASRMLAWLPDLQPGPEALREAEQTLRFLGANSHELVTQQRPSGRNERRWRRQVLMRACRLQHWGMSPKFEYRDKCPIFEWVAANRELIAAHHRYTFDVLFEQESPDPPPPALGMPTALYSLRRRPAMSENEWMVFGDTSLYDLIPVRPVKDPE